MGAAMFLHPRQQLARDPARAAIVVARDGSAISFGELDRRANRCAHLLRQFGVTPGQRVALWMENDPRFYEICWAAHNTGLLYVPVSARLSPREAAYIVDDCDARVVLVSPCMAVDALQALLGEEVQVLVVGAGYEQALECMPDSAPSGEVRGAAMVYSSGTTGHPKGVIPVLDQAPIDAAPAVTVAVVRLYGFDGDTVYLSTAPLYHTAPLKFGMSVQAAGGTVVMMERFEPEAALDALARYRVTHSQWVPTMFVRLLRLPPARRQAADLSAHRVAIHSAAPCRIDVKQAMLDWWGPIVHEYYAGSESAGMCAITPQEWLRKRGSVGRAARGAIHVLDEQGKPCAPGQTGLVYFSGGSVFHYHKDAAKTARSVLSNGLATFGDIGHVDEDGYLFLTDRRDNVIIAGGVNIYPQEAENLLAGHPEVADVAVFGIPHAEYGEEVKAVVALHDPARAGAALAAQLIAFCRDNLASHKCPRSIDFDSDLPREPTGKLFKRLLKARYWSPAAQPHSEG